MNFSHLFNKKTTPPTAAQISITKLDDEINHAQSLIDTRLHTLRYDKMTALRAQYCYKSDNFPLMAVVTTNGDLIAAVPNFLPTGYCTTYDTYDMHLCFNDERAPTADELGCPFG